MVPILSTNTTPFPTGPRQIAFSLNLGFQLAPKGIVTSIAGVMQPFVANQDGTAPLALGAPVNLPPLNDPAMTTFLADLASAFQKVVTAKSL